MNAKWLKLSVMCMVSMFFTACLTPKYETCEVAEESQELQELAVKEPISPKKIIKTAPPQKVVAKAAPQKVQTRKATVTKTRAPSLTHKKLTSTKVEAKERVLLLMTEMGYVLQDESENKQVYMAQAGMAQTMVYKFVFTGVNASQPRKVVTFIFAGSDGNVLVKPHSAISANGVYGQAHQNDFGNMDIQKVLAQL